MNEAIEWIAGFRENSQIFKKRRIQRFFTELRKTDILTIIFRPCQCVELIRKRHEDLFYSVAYRRYNYSRTPTVVA